MAGQLEAGRFNRVVAASWRHDETLGFSQFIATYCRCGEDDDHRGFVVAFERDVRAATLNDRSVRLLLQWVELSEEFKQQDNQGLMGIRLGREQSLVTPLRIEPVRIDDGQIDPADGLVRDFATLGPGEELANGVRIFLGESGKLREQDFWESMMTRAQDVNRVRQVTVVLHGAMIADAEGEALDGDHIFPFVPQRSSGNGAEGGDWVGMMRIQT